MKMRSEAYRPPHQRPMGDSERVRYNEICAFKGGKILPNELTAVPLEVLPSEQKAKAEEARRIENVRRRRAGLPGVEEEAERRASAAAQRPGRGGALAEQLEAEIEERRAHLAEMDALGAKSGNERTIALEIKSRVTELARLNPDAAKDYGVVPGKEDEAFAALRATAPWNRK